MSKRVQSFILMAIFTIGVLAYGNHIETLRVAKEQELPLIGEITVYTDIPSNISVELAKQYQDINHIKVNLMPLTEKQLSQRLMAEEPLEDGDVVITSKDNLQLGQRNDKFDSVLFPTADLVSSYLKNDDGYWVGIWYDPIVFIEKENANRQYAMSWDSLLAKSVKNVVIPDFAATSTAANILYSFVEIYGKEQAMTYFGELKKHIEQYAKYVGTPARLVVLGEANIGISTYSNVQEYVNKNRTVKMIYPTDGTPYTMTGVAVLKSVKHEEESCNFVQWLLTEEVQTILNNKGIYYMYANPEIKKQKDSIGHEIKLLPTESIYTEEGKTELVDEWIKAIRF